MKEIVLTHQKKLAIFLGIILAIIYRSPELFIQPRFWAEEAPTYFKYAYENSFLDGLFMVVGGGEAGYLLLLGNISAVLATLVPLKYAPFVTTYFSLFIYLIPFIIILWGNSYVWDTPLKKILAVLIMLFSPSVSTPEVWLNMVNSQVYCGIISLCILFEKDDISTKQTIFYCIVLLFAGLTGVYTTFLALPFFIKLLIERNKKVLWYFGIVVLVSSIQFGLFLLLKLSGDIATVKANYFDWGKIFVRIFYFHILTPLLSADLTSIISLKLTGSINIEGFITSGQTPYPVLLGINLLSFLFISFVLIYLFKLNRSPYHWIFLSAFICSALLITFGAVNGVPMSRYTVVPGAILSFFMLSNLSSNRTNLPSTIMLLSSIIIGMYYYKHSSTDMFFRYTPQHANWTDEVQKWQENNGYHLKIWPRGWSTTLSPPTMSLAERNELAQFDYILSQQLPFQFDLSLPNEIWQHGEIKFAANSLPANFILGMQLSLDDKFESLYRDKRLAMNIVFLGKNQKLCLNYNALLSLNYIFGFSRPFYFIPLNYMGAVPSQNITKLPEFIDDCSHQEIESIGFFIKSIDKAPLPIIFEMSNFHSKFVEEKKQNKKYSLLDLF